MDFKVASSIYRKAWLIESQAALTHLDLVEQIKAGTASFTKRRPGALLQFSANSDVITAPIDRFNAKTHPGYEGKSLAVLPITGALMKEDYCGWYGTASLRNEFNRINATDSIKTIVLQIDSPGGTVDGTQALADAIAASEKEVVAVIDGMACSAAYWIASAADKIIATSQTDIIGSIGTMISFYDRSAYYEEMGMVLREYYADASKDKNKDFREARDGNGHLLIEQMLNPINDLFLSAVKANRGEKLNEKETLSGKTFVAAKAMEYGLIDEISSFDKTINNLLQKNKTTFSMSKWKALVAFLGLSATTDKVELKEEDLDKVEASINDLNTITEERDQLKTRVQELEAAATANETKITGLEGQVSALTTERDNFKAEVERLGKLDAGKFTEAKAGGDKFNDAEETDAMKMDFQQELLNLI